jgi:hypothetical protein
VVFGWLRQKFSLEMSYLTIYGLIFQLGIILSFASVVDILRTRYIVLYKV